MPAQKAASPKAASPKAASPKAASPKAAKRGPAPRRTTTATAKKKKSGPAASAGMFRLCRGDVDGVAVPKSAKSTKAGMVGAGGVDGGTQASPRSTLSISWGTLERLTYFDASKRVERYTYYPGDLASDDVGPRCARRWGVVSRRSVVATLLDGVETSNVAQPGDFIVCGPVGEKYVVRLERMSELYERAPDEPTTMLVRPGAPRRVACYEGEDGNFEPSWGGRMTLKHGDYVVREAKNKYYRIEKGVFNATYDKV